MSVEASGRSERSAGAPQVVRARVASLDLEVRLSGEGAESLLPELCASPAAGRPTLSLSLRARGGPAPSFDRLALRRDGRAWLCAGDGLDGALGPEEGALEVHGGAPALQAALRLAVSLWLAPRGGLLLHGACAEAGGQALGLLGPSGAGKTTLSRRLAARGLHVVSDEVLCVRAGRAFGHPLPRRLGDGRLPPDGAPLAALARLAHAAPGAEPGARRLSPAEAARELLARVFLPARDAALLEPVLAAVEALARAVPLVALALPDDARAADAALALLGGGAP